MPAGAFVIPDKAKLNFLGPVNLLNPNNSYKISLHTSAYAPAPATMEVYADLTNELPTGGGYTAGGLTLANDALTLAGGVVKFTADPAQWTATGGGIPAWRVAVIRASGTLGGKVDPIVAYFLGDATPADIPLTTAPNTLTITPNANGIITG